MTEFTSIDAMSMEDIRVFAEEQAELLRKHIKAQNVPEEGAPYITVLNKLAKDIALGKTNLSNARRLILAYQNWIDQIRLLQAEPKKTTRRKNLVAVKDVTVQTVFGANIPSQFKPDSVFFKKGDIARAVEHGALETTLDLSFAGFDLTPVVPSSYFKSKVA